MKNFTVTAVGSKDLGIRDMAPEVVRLFKVKGDDVRVLAAAWCVRHGRPVFSGIGRHAED